MAFRDSIQTLLDTYSNCVSLLKTFTRGRDESGAKGGPHQPSRLRKSLRADRSLVEQAYSSRVSESGKRFKRGDARAIAALDRILKKLRDAIANILRLSNKKDGLELDYRSLKSLSNASRVDAIKAIDGLSRRLGSPSRTSVASSSSRAPSSKASSASRQKQKSSSTTVGFNSKKAPRDRERSPPTKISATTAKDSSAAKMQPKAKPAGQGDKTSPRTRSSQSMSASPESSKTPVAHRVSMLSFSSDSTKLGEIPQRKWHSSKHQSDPTGDEYNMRPMYPLKPYTVEVKEKRFLGLFRRRRDD